MTLLDKFIVAKKPATTGTPEDPKWSRTDKGYFRRLLTLDPEALGLSGKSGVYVVWHGGLRPSWVYAGASEDLAQAFHTLGDDDIFMEYESKGGLFITWAIVREEFQDGVVRYLNEVMNPLVENPAVEAIDDDPIPVILPGKEKSRV